MELIGKKINVLGDSITYGVGASSEETSYVGLLKKEYGEKNVNNYGISGTRIAKRRVPYTIFPQADQDFLSRIDSMEKDADLIIVFGGVNDYGHGDAIMGEPNGFDEYTFYGALNSLFKKLYMRYPNSQLLILTPLHRFEEEKENMLGYKLEDYVNAIRARAEKYSVPVLDLYTVSGIYPADEDLKLMYTIDGLHPNDKGHNRIFQLLNNYIKNIL